MKHFAAFSPMTLLTPHGSVSSCGASVFTLLSLGTFHSVLTFIFFYRALLDLSKSSLRSFDGVIKASRELVLAKESLQARKVLKYSL